MKAIQTKYLGATNQRGSRIKACTEGGNTITIPYPHELSGDAVHRLAAQALCDKLGWNRQFVTGGLPNGDYCHVFTE